MASPEGGRTYEQKETVALLGDVRRLGRLAMGFARIYRATYYEDGQPESDAEHSFMLALTARSVAAQLLPELDANKVAWYAVVHDLLEVYTGDEPTLNATADSLAQKAAREHEAMQRFRQEFGDAWPSLVASVEAYERQEEPEARYIKVFDKVVASLCHLISGPQTFEAVGITTYAEFLQAVAAVNAKLVACAGDQTLALALRQAVIQQIGEEMF